MPSLYEDFFNPYFWQALGGSVLHGLKVLLLLGVLGALFTFLSGGTQPKHWPKSEHH